VGGALRGQAATFEVDGDLYISPRWRRGVRDTASASEFSQRVVSRPLHQSQSIRAWEECLCCETDYSALTVKQVCCPSKLLDQLTPGSVLASPSSHRRRPPPAVQIYLTTPFSFDIHLDPRSPKLAVSTTGESLTFTFSILPTHKVICFLLSLDNRRNGG